MAKKKNKKEKVKQIVLNRNYAIATSLIVGLVISYLGSRAFYKIITKLAPNDDASLTRTVFTVTPLLFIGMLIVLLFILLVSQINLDD